MKHFYFVFLTTVALINFAGVNANAAQGGIVSKRRIFMVACEQGFMSFFMEYGNGSTPNKKFYDGMKSTCAEITKNVTATEWRVMKAPTESGCTTAIKMMLDANGKSSGLPSQTELFSKYCATPVKEYK